MQFMSWLYIQWKRKLNQVICVQKVCRVQMTSQHEKKSDVKMYWVWISYCQFKMVKDLLVALSQSEAERPQPGRVSSQLQNPEDPHESHDPQHLPHLQSSHKNSRTGETKVLKGNFKNLLFTCLIIKMWHKICYKQKTEGVVWRPEVLSRAFLFKKEESCGLWSLEHIFLSFIYRHFLNFCK